MKEQRDYQLDNIKALMIFCVIFSHAISELFLGREDHIFMKALQIFINTFHMPVFIFISGYLSKRKTDYETYILKAMKTCLIPYIIFNVINGIPSIGKMLNIFVPNYTLWYLLSLFFWKILIEISVKFKWPIPIALLLSMCVGLVPAGAFLSIARTIGFFPFFLAGYLCQKKDIQRIRGVNKLLPVVIFLIDCTLVAFMIKQGIKESALISRVPYSESGLTALEGITIRAANLVTASLCIVAFIILIPQRKTVISEIGTCSITVYLAHSGIIRALKYLKIIKISNPFVFLAFDIVFALIICFAFGNRKVMHLYQKIMDKISAFVLIA